MHHDVWNMKAEYEMDRIIIGTVTDVKDLEIIAENSLIVHKQVSNALNKANKVWGITFLNNNKNIMPYLYNSLDRPPLLYVIQTKRPCLQFNIMTMKKVWKHMIRMTQGFKDTAYKNSFVKLKLSLSRVNN